MERVTGVALVLPKYDGRYYRNLDFGPPTPQGYLVWQATCGKLTSRTATLYILLLGLQLHDNNFTQLCMGLKGSVLDGPFCLYSPK